MIHHLRIAQVWHWFSRHLTDLPAHMFICNRNEPYLPLGLLLLVLLLLACV